MGAEAKVKPHVWTAREHAARAGELAAAIQPAQERFEAALADPMERTKAIAMGAIKAHKAAIDHTLRVAELHARVADVLLRTDTVGVSHDEAVRRAAVALEDELVNGGQDAHVMAKLAVAAIFPLSELRWEQ